MELLGAFETGHRRNIFCAEFVPINLSQVITCGADGDMRLTDITKETNGSLTSKTSLLYAHPGSTAMKFEFLPTCSSAFLATYSNGEVKLIDLRSDNKEEKLIVDMESACYGLSFDPTHPHEFAISSGDHLVRTYDLRKSPLPFGRDLPNGCIMMYSTSKFLEQMGLGDTIDDDWGGWGRQRFSPTDVCFNSKGELLVNYSGYDVLLYDSSENAKKNNFPGLNGTPICTNVLQKYKGRKNEETFLKEVHFLADEQFVTTGADSGELFIWDTVSGQLVSQLQGDKLIVNSIAAHPFYTTVAVSGIDNDIKVFEYRGDNPFPNKRKFEEKDSSPFGLSQRIRSNKEKDVFSESEAKEVLSGAQEIKIEADNYFNQNNPKEAAQKYHRCIRKLNFHPPNQFFQKEIISLIVKCNLNLAACYLKLKDYDRVIDTCTSVLSFDPRNTKALYRRANAHLFLSHLKKAQKDISKALQLKSEDIEIQALSQKIEKEIELKGKNNNFIFSKMFNKN